MSRSPLADFKPLDELPEFTRTALLELLTKGADIEFKNMSARLSPLGIDVLTDLSWTESHGSGKNRRTVTVERTVMFFHRQVGRRTIENRLTHRKYRLRSKS